MGSSRETMLLFHRWRGSGPRRAATDARLAPRLADGLEMIRSGVLGLDLRAEGEFIRMRDPATREDILHQGELKALAEREAVRRKDAEARARREAAERWSRRLASRSWRPLLSVLKSALSGVCGLVRPTASLRSSEIRRSHVRHTLFGVRVALSP